VHDLFATFRNDPFNIEECRKAVAELVALPPDEPVTADAWEFLLSEDPDEVRTWAISVIRDRPDADSPGRLVEFVRDMKDSHDRREYKYARLFALKAILVLADTPEREAALDQLLEEVWADASEDALPRAFAAAVGAARGRRAARDELDGLFDLLRENRGWWLTWALLRALRESPVGQPDGLLPQLVGERLLPLIREQRGFLDHRNAALEIIGAFPVAPAVVRGVGEVLVDDRNDYLRLSAAHTLVALGERAAAAWRDLVQAASDGDAEVRVQAVTALAQALGDDKAVGALVDAAMQAGVTDQQFECLVDALRQLDRDRTRTTALISKELTGDDRDRVQRAEKMLLELGGWSAVQRLGRRDTLRQLDAMLKDSEKVVQATFEGTIRQARINFTFALAVNVIVVLVGVALIVVAISHLISQPDDLASWILPGGGGVLGIVLAQFFNNPRQNAREDLTTLVNVNVLFLGFLRQINQIDATFKHAYIESRDFGTPEMVATVDSTRQAVERTLDLALHHLRFRDGDAATVVKQAEPLVPKSPNGETSATPSAASRVPDAS
jgi:hypothetical protein